MKRSIFISLQRSFYYTKEYLGEKKLINLLVNQCLGYIMTQNNHSYNIMKPLVGKGKVGICELVEKYDLLRYLREVGYAKFPTIVMLLRIHLGKFNNSTAMITKQANMRL